MRVAQLNPLRRLIAWLKDLLSGTGLGGVPLHLIAACAAILALSACATTLHFTKPGFDQGQFNQDYGDCRVKAYQAGQMVYGNPSEDFLRSCMMSHGYSEAQK